MTAKGQKKRYNVKVLRGYSVSIALKNSEVSLRNGTDVFTGEARKEEWFVTIAADDFSPSLTCASFPKLLTFYCSSEIPCGVIERR